jgi:hypothetical protein
MLNYTQCMLRFVFGCRMWSPLGLIRPSNSFDLSIIEFEKLLFHTYHGVCYAGSLDHTKNVIKIRAIYTVLGLRLTILSCSFPISSRRSWRRQQVSPLVGWGKNTYRSPVWQDDCVPSLDVFVNLAPDSVKSKTEDKDRSFLLHEERHRRWRCCMACLRRCSCGLCLRASNLPVESACGCSPSCSRAKVLITY